MELKSEIVEGEGKVVEINEAGKKGNIKRIIRGFSMVRF